MRIGSFLEKWKSEKNSEQGVRNKISLILFICSIMVIYVHAHNLDTYGITSESIGFAKAVFLIETYLSRFVHLAVPIFFMISGFLFFRTFEIKALLSKWKSRLFSVVIPYVIWCSLYYLYYVLCTNIPAIRNIMHGAEQLPLSVTAWLDSLWVNEYYTLWFLKNLIVFIALSPIIYFLLKNGKKVPHGLIVLIVLEIVLNIPAFSHYAEMLSLQGLDIYLVGCYIGINHKNVIYYRNKLISIFSVIVLAGFFVTGFSFTNVITELLFTVSLWFAFDWFTVKNIPWWMTITFFTYVAHDVFLEALEKVVKICCSSSPVVALLDYVLAPIIIEAFLILVAYILIRFTPKLWKLITGGRTTIKKAISKEAD